MDMLIMLLIAMIVNVAHYEEVGKWAKQCQPHKDNSIDRDFQEIDCCQPKDGKQTTQ